MWAGADGLRHTTTQEDRATTGPGCAQTGRVMRQHKQVARQRKLVARTQVPKVRKLWKAISHSKLVQIGRLRCFLASTGNVDAKNTSNARFGQVLSEIWPAEVFWSQNSCGRAQTGRDVRQRKQVVRRRVLVACRRVSKVKKLWKAISHSKLVQIRRLRCFLAFTGNVNAKKYLKRLIQTSFE